MYICSRWLIILLTKIASWLRSILDEFSTVVTFLGLFLFCDTRRWCLYHWSSRYRPVVLFQILILREISAYALSFWIMIQGLWDNLVMENLVWGKFWRDHFLARILGCCMDVLFKAMLDVQITCTSSTGCRLLITYSFIDLSHIMNWHFLEIATRCVEFLCSPDISADLFLLLAGRFSIITLRTILATRRNLGSICNHVAPIRSLD